MRSHYLLLIALFFTSAVNAQIVFESDLSTWDAGTPTDWFGFKTQIEADSVEQDTDSPTYGTALARLINLQSQHRRFTTQPISLQEGETYEVEVWVRGNGEIRTGLFDGDLEGGDFGYQNYNSYETITSADVVSFIQVVSPDTTNDVCELILSTRNGVVEVDRVELRIGMPVEPVAATIYDIQFTMDADGDSPLENDLISTSGIVTAVAPFGYYIQEMDAAWSGIYVNDADNVPAVGDEVSVAGTVEEFFGNTRITNVEDYQVISAGNTFNPVMAGTMALNDEQFEGVFVMTEGTCADTTGYSQYNEWFVNDGTGQIMINDQIYNYEPTPGVYYEVMGPVQYAFSEYKIEPRSIDDVAVSSDLDEFVVDFSIFPNPFEDQLRVNLVTQGQDMSYVIYDMTGRQVITGSLVTGSENLDLSELVQGTYMLNVFVDGQMDSSVLVKE